MNTLIEMPARNAASTRASEDRLRLFTLGDLLFWFYLYPGRWLAQNLPVALFYALGKLGDPLMQFQARSRSRRGARWMTACGCASPERAVKLVRKSVSLQLSRYLDELVALRRAGSGTPATIPCTGLTCTGIEGWEHFERARAEGKGVILLTAHFGNRAGVAYLNAQGHAVLSIHNRSLPSPAGGRLGWNLQARFVELRHQANPEVVYIQDPQCTLKILRKLRNGGAVKILMDGVAKTKGIDCEFLGSPWRAPAGILEMARVSGSAVVPMATLGSARGFRLWFGPELALEPGETREKFAAANLPRFLGAVEQLILAHPEQWSLWTQF